MEFVSNSGVDRYLGAHLTAVQQGDLESVVSSFVWRH